MGQFEAGECGYGHCYVAIWGWMAEDMGWEAEDMEVVMLHFWGGRLGTWGLFCGSLGAGVWGLQCRSFRAGGLGKWVLLCCAF